MMGSLTGAVSSQRVTEEHKGTLSAVGHRALSVKAQGCLTARQTSRAGTKVGLSDPVVLHGRAIAQRTKGTPGITGSSFPRVHIDGRVWHLNIWGGPAEMSAWYRLITVKPSAWVRSEPRRKIG